VPRYRLVNAAGEPLGEASYATEIHDGDVIHWPQTERLRVVSSEWDVEADIAVLTVEAVE
jgi:hypothetical protein